MRKILSVFFAVSLTFVNTTYLFATEAPTPASQPALAKQAFSAQDTFKQRISLDLRDMDIVDVLKFLSLKGKFNVVVSKGIAGRVTLVMKEVTIGEALDIILRANNLAYNRINNIVYIMTAEEYLGTYGKKFNDQTDVRIVNLKYAKPSYILAALDSLKSNVGKIVIDEDTGSVVLIDTADNLAKMIQTIEQIDNKAATMTYKLQYALAKDVAAQLKSKLDAKSVGSINADDRSNQLFITAFPERMKEITELIQNLDVPTKAVLIDVRILKITMNPQFDSGVDWSNLFGNSHDDKLQNLKPRASFPISTNISAAGALTGIASLTYGTLDAGLLQAEIKALKQVADTRLIAHPRLMVTNNEEANIHIGDTIPYVTSTTTGTGDTATVSEQINFIDIGIKLKVLAKINDEGMVTMKVRPEISSKTADIETPQHALIPQVNTTFVETNVIVKDEHTVIIGGLKQLDNSSTKKGLPYLMDIPVAGNAFRSNSKNVRDTEIAIFLTPHIVAKNHDVNDEKQTIHDDRDYEEERKSALSEVWNEAQAQKSDGKKGVKKNG